MVVARRLPPFQGGQLVGFSWYCAEHDAYLGERIGLSGVTFIVDRRTREWTQLYPPP